MYKKILILICSIYIGFITFTSANDCNILSSSGYNINNWETKGNILKIFPKEALGKSFDNLNKYCCTLNKGCKANDNSLYPRSSILFDHILDVYLRRIDANTGINGGDDLTYGLSNLDGSGVERRSFITNKGNNIYGSLPSQIEKEYNKYWTITTEVTNRSDLEGSAEDEREKSIESAFQSIDSWTLEDKYSLACDVSLYIVKLINPSYSLRFQEKNYYEDCKEIIKNRIKAEGEYTKAIMMQESNILLINNMNNYMDKYFVQNKLSKLQQTFMGISSSFFEINRAISGLTPQCS